VRGALKTPADIHINGDWLEVFSLVLEKANYDFTAQVT
jgi:hypothetical protein